METVNVFIETQLETMTSFGVRVDNGEGVFIPARLAKKHNIVEEETRAMVLLPNVGDDAANTPWKAMTMSMTETTKPAEETPRVEVAKLEDRIMAYFDVVDNEHAITAPALAENLGVEDLQMQLALTRMHNAGDMAKAQVHVKGGQEKASWVLWAPSADWFAW